MNLCSRHTFCPQKAYDRTLFLLGAIYKFRSHPHHSVTTLILNCEASRLADWLVTWHSQTPPITTPPALTVSRENIKVRKRFEDPSYNELERICKDTIYPSLRLNSSIKQRKIQAKFFKLVYSWDIMTILIQVCHGFPVCPGKSHAINPHQSTVASPHIHCTSFLNIIQSPNTIKLMR